MLDNLDPAIYDRAKRWGVVRFELPNLEQRRLWWSRHARQLMDSEHLRLAELSQDFSFRDMAGVADGIVRKDARKGHVVSRSKDPNFETYEEAIRALLRDRKKSHLVSEYLRPLPRSGFKWSDYFGSEELLRELRCIADSVDPGNIDAVKLVRSQCYSATETTTASDALPIFLFHGPPGTGKTYAMQVIAAMSGNMRPYILNLKGLLESEDGAEAMFSSILDAVERLDNAMVFVDECEQYFPKRGVLAGYASVHVQLQKKILATFIEWADGLESRQIAKTRVVLCMATNMPEQLDPAVLDRVHQTTKFGLPAEAERRMWWKSHAMHLTSGQHAELARLSADFSYRTLRSVSDKVIRIFAVTQRGSSDKALGCPPIEEYTREISNEAIQARTSATEKFKQLGDLVVHGLSMLNQLSWGKQNLGYLISKL